jgi:hypothetical protein
VSNRADSYSPCSGASFRERGLLPIDTYRREQEEKADLEDDVLLLRDGVRGFKRQRVGACLKTRGEFEVHSERTLTFKLLCIQAAGRQLE